MPKPSLLDYEVNWLKEHPQKTTRRKKLEKLSKKTEGQDVISSRTHAKRTKKKSSHTSPEEKNKPLQGKINAPGTTEESTRDDITARSSYHDKDTTSNADDHGTQGVSDVDEKSRHEVVDEEHIGELDEIDYTIPGFWDRTDQKLAVFGPARIRKQGQRAVESRFSSTRELAQTDKHRMDSLLKKLQKDPRMTGIGSNGGHIARQNKDPGPLNGHRSISRQDSFISIADIGKEMEGRAPPKVFLYRDLNHPDWNHRFIEGALLSPTLMPSPERPLTAPEPKGHTGEFREEYRKLFSSSLKHPPASLLQHGGGIDDDPRNSHRARTSSGGRRKDPRSLPPLQQQQQLEQQPGQQQRVWAGSSRERNREGGGDSPQARLQKLHVQVTEARFAVPKFSNRKDQYSDNPSSAGNDDDSEDFGFLFDSSAPIAAQGPPPPHSQSKVEEPPTSTQAEPQSSSGGRKSSRGDTEEEEIDQYEDEFEPEEEAVPVPAEHEGQGQGDDSCAPLATTPSVGEGNADHSEKQLGPQDKVPPEGSKDRDDESVRTLVQLAEQVWLQLMRELRLSGGALTGSDLSELAALREPAEAAEDTMGFVCVLLGLKAEWRIASTSLLRELRLFRSFLTEVGRWVGRKNKSKANWLLNRR